MPGDIVRRNQNTGRQLQRQVTAARNQLVARQSNAEDEIRSRREVGEYAAFEVNYLVGVANIVATNNPAAAPAVDAIVNLTVGGIIRSVGEFGSSL